MKMVTDKSKQKMEVETEAAPKVEEEVVEDETQWSGFFTRNKKHRVGVDAKFLTGKEHLL